MYLNLAAAKTKDPEGYDTLVDIITFITNMGEESMVVNSINYGR